MFGLTLPAPYRGASCLWTFNRKVKRQKCLVVSKKHSTNWPPCFCLGPDAATFFSASINTFDAGKNVPRHFILDGINSIPFFRSLTADVGRLFLACKSHLLHALVTPFPCSAGDNKRTFEIWTSNSVECTRMELYRTS